MAENADGIGVDEAAELLGRIARGFLARGYVNRLRQLRQAEEARMQRERQREQRARARQQQQQQDSSCHSEGVAQVEHADAAARVLQRAVRSFLARKQLKELRHGNATSSAAENVRAQDGHTPEKPSLVGLRESAIQAMQEDIGTARIASSLRSLQNEDARCCRAQLPPGDRSFQAVKAHRASLLAADTRAWWKQYVETEDAKLRDAITLEAQRRATR